MAGTPWLATVIPLAVVGSIHKYRSICCVTPRRKSFVRITDQIQSGFFKTYIIYRHININASYISIIFCLLYCRIYYLKFRVQMSCIFLVFSSECKQIRIVSKKKVIKKVSLNNEYTEPCSTLIGRGTVYI